MKIYEFITVAVNLHVSVTFCGLLQGGNLRRLYYRDAQANVKYIILSFCYMIHNICQNTKYRVRPADPTTTSPPYLDADTNTNTHTKTNKQEHFLLK